MISYDVKFYGEYFFLYIYVYISWDDTSNLKGLSGVWKWAPKYKPASNAYRQMMIESIVFLGPFSQTNPV